MYKINIETLEAIKKQLVEANRLLELAPQKLFDIEFMIMENQRLIDLITTNYGIK